MNATRTMLWVGVFFSATAMVAAQPRSTPLPATGVSLSQPYSLDALIEIAIGQHPVLSQAQFEIEAAQGRAMQASKYPNPTVGISGEEIGRHGGIHTLPLISQEIVTAKKLQWSRAVAEREVDQTFLALVSKRFTLVTEVRRAFFEVVATQRRRDTLHERVKVVTKTLEEAKKLLKVLPEEGAEVVPLAFQYELDRLGLELVTSQREYVAAWNRLAAAAGVPSLAAPPGVADFLLDRLPSYAVDPEPLKSQRQFAQLREQIVETHPEVRFARVGIAKAEATVGLERAQAVPNVTVGGGYSRNYNDRENQATYQIGVPLPIFNRNQGNIRAARAELGRAVAEVSRTQIDLSNRLASAYGQYVTAKMRAEQLDSMRKTAKKLYESTYTAYFKGGKLTNLQVIQSQRQMIEAELDFIRAWGDAWKSASDIAGLTLDDDWPGLRNR